MDKKKRERDVYIAAGLNTAYESIKMALGSDEPYSHAKIERLAVLATKHMFKSLENQNVTRLPLDFSSQEESVKKARQIADEFIKVYADRLWYRRDLDQEREEQFHDTIRDFMIAIFPLTIDSSEIDDDEDEVIEDFLKVQPDEFDFICPRTLEELSRYMRLHQLPSDLVGPEDGVKCRSCGELFMDHGHLMIHSDNCVKNYTAVPTAHPAGPESVPRYVPGYVPDLSGS